MSSFPSSGDRRIEHASSGDFTSRRIHVYSTHVIRCWKTRLDISSQCVSRLSLVSHPKFCSPHGLVQASLIYAAGASFELRYVEKLTNPTPAPNYFGHALTSLLVCCQLKRLDCSSHSVSEACYPSLHLAQLGKKID